MLQIIRKIGYTILSRHFYVGIGIGFAIATSLGIAHAQSLLEADQNSYKTKNGVYFVDVKNRDFTINTYQTICTGYFTREETPTKTIYTGYGDLAQQFTYEVPKINTTRIATTTIKQ